MADSRWESADGNGCSLGCGRGKKVVFQLGGVSQEMIRWNQRGRALVGQSLEKMAVRINIMDEDAILI